MKTIAIVVALTVAAGLAVAAFLRESSPSERALEPLPKPPWPEAAKKVLGVDELVKNVERLSGDLTVEGVVGATSAEKNYLSLIDRAEFEACNSTTCAKLILPVRWTGAMPPVEAWVLVKGRVERTSDGMVFAALELQAASVTAGTAK